MAEGAGKKVKFLNEKLKSLTAKDALPVQELLPEGIHYVETNEIMFSQPTVSQNLSDNGTINKLVDDLRSGAVSVQDIPLIRVTQFRSRLYTIDHRRLIAFSMAGIEKIPVEIFSLEKNARLAIKLERRFDPIAQLGELVVIGTSSSRKIDLDLLKEFNLIKGIR